MPTRCYRNTLRLDKKCGDSFIPDDAECHEGGGGGKGGKGGGLATGIAAAGLTAAGVAGAAYGANQLRKKGKHSRLKDKQAMRNKSRSARNASKERRQQQANVQSGFNDFSKKAAAKKPTMGDNRYGGFKRNQSNTDLADIQALTLHLRSLQHNDSASAYDLSYAATRLDKKCGDSYIPDDAECHEGGGGSSGGSGGKLAAGIAATGLLAAGAGGAYAVHKKRGELNKGKSGKDKVGYLQAAQAVGGDVKKGAQRAYGTAATAGMKVAAKGQEVAAKGQKLAGRAKQAGSDVARGAREVGASVGHKAKRKGLRAAASVRRTGKKAKKAFSNNELNEDALYPDVASLAASGQLMLSEPECGCHQCRQNQPCSCR